MQRDNSVVAGGAVVFATIPARAVPRGTPERATGLMRLPETVQDWNNSPGESG